MKKTIFTNLFLFLCLANSGIKAQPLTLKQCVEQAQNLDRAKINVTQTKFEYIFRTKLLDFYQGKALE